MKLETTQTLELLKSARLLSRLVNYYLLKYQRYKNMKTINTHKEPEAWEMRNSAIWK